jgi:hypothetical protein
MKLTKKDLWQQIEALGKLSKDCPCPTAQEHIEQAIKILINHPLITGVKP